MDQKYMEYIALCEFALLLTLLHCLGKPNGVFFFKTTLFGQDYPTPHYQIL